MLVDIVMDLTEKVRDLGDTTNSKSISYNLKGEIVLDNRNREIYFKGRLIYETNFEEYLRDGVPQQRALNSGKMLHAPASDAKIKTDLIINMAEERSKKEGYQFSYNEKEDEITIKVLKNLRKESDAIGKSLGKPTRRIFEI